MELFDTLRWDPEPGWQGGGQRGQILAEYFEEQYRHTRQALDRLCELVPEGHQVKLTKFTLSDPDQMKRRTARVSVVFEAAEEEE